MRAVVVAAVLAVAGGSWGPGGLPVLSRRGLTPARYTPPLLQSLHTNANACSTSRLEGPGRIGIQFPLLQAGGRGPGLQKVLQELQGVEVAGEGSGAGEVGGATRPHQTSIQGLLLKRFTKLFVLSK